MDRAFDRISRPLARCLCAGALALAALLPVAAPSAAQNLFAPVIQINGSVITGYEVQQRALFLQVLNAPGIPAEEARDRLIEERLQMQAAKAMGITLTEEQIAAGQDEFAGRANMDRRTFIQALGQAGIGEETFRDFVIAGLLWREVIRQKFLGQVNVTEADVDRELSEAQPSAAGLRLLYSEIILPGDTPESRAQAQELAAQLSKITSIEAFSAAARDYSAAPSAGNGGQVDWVAARDMQPGLVQMLISMAPGQVSKPIPLPNAIALLQLRAVGDGLPPPPEGLTVDYAMWMIPGGRSPAALAEAGKVIAGAGTCDELYELNRRQRGPAERLVRETGPMSSVPRDIALELGHLDPGEFSTGVTRGGNLALLMLCSRSRPLPEGVTRDQVRNSLRERQMQAFAEAYLHELHDAAVIRVP